MSNLLAVLFFWKENVELLEFSEAFELVHSALSHHYGERRSASDFKYALREVEGTFVCVENGRLEFLNPSVRDYLEGAIRDKAVLDQILRLVTSSEQAEAVWEFWDENRASFGERAWIRTALEEAGSRLAELPDHLER